MIKRLKKDYGTIQVYWLETPFYTKFGTLVDTEIVIKKQLTLDL